jgi:ribulose-5-phosphate 4-epimerase/fuculose-1-phosphate aldolase
MGDKIHIIGGGTFSHVRNHMAIAAPAFGATARNLYGQIFKAIESQYHVERLRSGGEDTMEMERAGREYAANRVTLHLTKMAAPKQSKLVTNDDVAALLEELKADPDTRVIIMNAALCDYHGSILVLDGHDLRDADRTPSGSHVERLKTSEGSQLMRLHPAAKLIGEIRKTRKDIFVVGFKTTTGETSDSQYKIALNSLKAGSLNLVLANDTVTRNNMIVTPEEARYHETTDRDTVLNALVKITLARSTNTFTRSTVVPGEPVPWNSPLVPENLRKVVDYCIEKGAYKPFRGATVGHFAFRNGGGIITSKRKSNFNDLRNIGMVRVEYEGDDRVIAHGAKPSVGGQSQRIIFAEHDDVDCIVHFHCPTKPDSDIDRGGIIAPQWQNECGSHQCGKNTSDHLSGILFGDEDLDYDVEEIMDKHSLRVVMLENHGPNICFSTKTDPDVVIGFIEKNFDLSQKTGGLIAA